MPISHDHKCLFIHIPKTGGLSWRKMLNISEDSDSINETDGMVVHGEGHPQGPGAPLLSRVHPRIFEKMHFLMMHLIQLKLINKETFNSYFKFSFVRNPWDKLVSAYTQRFHTYFNDFELFIKTIINPVEYMNNNFVFDINDSFYENYNRILYNSFHGVDINKPYENRPVEVHDLLLDDYDYSIYFLPILIPQHLYICDESNNLLVNVVGKFENYVKNATSILDYLNIDSNIKKINNSDHPPYKEMYNNKTRDIVAKLYAIDIEMFGYEF